MKEVVHLLVERVCDGSNSFEQDHWGDIWSWVSGPEPSSVKRKCNLFSVGIPKLLLASLNSFCTHGLK